LKIKSFVLDTGTVASGSSTRLNHLLAQAACLPVELGDQGGLALQIKTGAKDLS
jgi:hypothetical protein